MNRHSSGTAAEQNRRIGELLGKYGGAYFALSPDGAVEDVSRAGVKLLGYSKAELLRKTFFDLVDPQTSQKAAFALGQLSEQLGPSSQPSVPVNVTDENHAACFEVNLLRKDGAWVPSQLRAFGDTRRGRLVRVHVFWASSCACAAEASNLPNRLIRAADETRRSIARELHDSTGQNLEALQINLNILARESAALSKPARTALKESLTLAKSAALEIRTLTYTLHPPILEAFGIPAAVRSYVERFSERTGIRVSLKLPSQLDRLPIEVELALFRIIQEGLTNIHRHSASEHARLTIRSEPDCIRLDLKDFGKSISPDAVPGVGIASMRERARELGGRLTVEPQRRGTLLSLHLPLAPKSPA